ncbi:MAG: STAS domain-containing protein [Planctomycetota bacterium]
MSSSELTAIPLSGSVGVAHVAELYATVTEACGTESAIAFDCTETRDIDASIVQVLLAVKALADEKGRDVEFLGPSETFSNLLTEYGFGDCIKEAPHSEDGQENATEQLDAAPSAAADAPAVAAADAPAVAEEAGSTAEANAVASQEQSTVSPVQTESPEASTETSDGEQK